MFLYFIKYDVFLLCINYLLDFSDLICQYSESKHTLFYFTMIKCIDVNYYKMKGIQEMFDWRFQKVTFGYFSAHYWIKRLCGDELLPAISGTEVSTDLFS